ncbi:MAG: GPGG-motif small membrane protein [Ilumatobacteraceae bacterium]
MGGDLTAKDFRTWHATVLAAAALAMSDEPGDTKASRTRAVREAVKEVAEYLGNTPTIARNSYIDPRVIDRYEEGVTIRDVAERAHRSPLAVSPTSRRPCANCSRHDWTVSFSQSRGTRPLRVALARPRDPIEREAPPMNATILWIIAAILVIVGIVQLFQDQIILGIVLIALGLLVGPGGVSIFSRRH